MKGCFSSSARVRHFFPRFFEISADKEEDIIDKEEDIIGLIVLLLVRSSKWDIESQTLELDYF